MGLAISNLPWEGTPNRNLFKISGFCFKQDAFFITLDGCKNVSFFFADFLYNSPCNLDSLRTFIKSLISPCFSEDDRSVTENQVFLL